MTQAFLAAIGATGAAKRIATSHVAFNMIAGGLAVLILPLFGSFAGECEILL